MAGAMVTFWCNLKMHRLVWIFQYVKLESANVDSLELVWHCLHGVVEFLVFCHFECCNFSIESMLTIINEQGVFCLGEIEGVAKGHCGVVGINVRQDQGVTAQLSTKESPMDDNVSGFGLPVVTCD